MRRRSARRSRRRPTARETVTLERESRRRLARHRLRDPLTGGARARRGARRVALVEVRLPRVRRRGDLESRRSRSSSARSAAPSRRRSSTPAARSSSTISSRRCAASATTRAAGRRKSGRSSARAATRSRCSIPTRQAQNCEFCGSAQLVPYEETKPAFRPGERAAVQGQRDRGARAHPRVVRQAVARAERAQAPGADRHGARRLPAVLDLRRARRRARGPPRPATTTTRPRPTPRTASTRTRQVQHVRWEPAAGALAAFLRRRPRLRVGRRASGAAARHRAVPDAASSSPTTPATSPAGSSSATRSISSPRRSARATRWTRKLQALCAQQMPGDTYRNLSVRADYSGQTFKHILAPVWLLSYNYGARAFQCVMNGVTGAMRGEYPKSPWKIALLVLAIVIVVVIVLVAVGGIDGSADEVHGARATLHRRRSNRRGTMHAAIVTGVSRGLGEALAASCSRAAPGDRHRPDGQRAAPGRALSARRVRSRASARSSRPPCCRRCASSRSRPSRGDARSTTPRSRRRSGSSDGSTRREVEAALATNIAAPLVLADLFCRAFPERRAAAADHQHLVGRRADGDRRAARSTACRRPRSKC